MPRPLWQVLEVWRRNASYTCSGHSHTLSHFWDHVKLHLRKFTHRPIPDTPAFFLLHLNSFPAHSYKSSVLPHLLNAARSCVAEFWKCPRPLPLSRWFQKVNEIIWIEELVAVDLGTQEKFGNTCYYWKEFSTCDDFLAALRGSETLDEP